MLIFRQKSFQFCIPPLKTRQSVLPYFKYFIMYLHKDSRSSWARWKPDEYPIKPDELVKFFARMKWRSLHTSNCVMRFSIVSLSSFLQYTLFGFLFANMKSQFFSKLFLPHIMCVLFCFVKYSKKLIWWEGLFSKILVLAITDSGMSFRFRQV